MRRLWAVCIMLALTVCVSFADYWSEAPDPQPLGRVGEDVTIPFKLTQNTVGISGHLVFDPDKFSNPRIAFEPGQGQDVVVVGQAMEPGRFRFAIYDNPLASLNRTSPIARFLLQVDTTDSVNETVSFVQNRASAGDLSFQTVDLAPVTVMLNKNMARNWSLYE